MAREKEIFFFISDISGYTSSMLTQPNEYEHAKKNLTILVETIAKHTSPLKISALAGDAVYFYSDESIQDSLWLSHKIFSLFELFEKEVHTLKLSDLCPCSACKNIDKLKLKVLSHYGKAADRHLIQRLLKNHVPIPRYFLLTEAAYQHTPLPENVKISKMEESNLPIYVCEPPAIPETELPISLSFFTRAHRWYWFHLGKKIQGQYLNLPPLK